MEMQDVKHSCDCRLDACTRSVFGRPLLLQPLKCCASITNQKLAHISLYDIGVR